MNAARLPSAEWPSINGDRKEVWTATIEVDPMEDGTSCHADVFENGRFVCRIVLAGAFRSTATAEDELNRRFERWIAERDQRSAQPGQD